MKVLAAIVTFNRLNLLKRCIKNVLSQNRKLDDLIVINNSSTDGTNEYLINNKINNITQLNTGSAGGWFTAINYAIINKFDYIWLMDDDGYPDKNSLKKLLNHIDESYSCLSSIVIDENNNSKLVFPMPYLNKNQLPKIFSIRRKIYNIIDFNSSETLSNEYDFCHLFNGSLISINHIKKIGNINVNYFMYGDEVDYFFRLRKVGKVKTLLTSLHFHPNVTKRPISIIKLYYYIKNSIILNFKYFDYSILRSILNINVGILRFIIRNSLRDNLRFILSLKVKHIYFAIHRGFKSKLEIDYEK